MQITVSQFPPRHIPAFWANVDPDLKAFLVSIGVVNPTRISTKQASAVLAYLAVPTAVSTLEVYRCQGRGPSYTKIASRVFYQLSGLRKYADGVDIKIFDPSQY